MRGQPEASPARSAAPGGPRRAAGIPPGPGDARRRPYVARPLPDPVAIRLCPVPETAPPYDDEAPGTPGAGRAADALAAAIVSALPGDGRPGREAGVRPADAARDRGGPQPPRTARTPSSAGQARAGAAGRGPAAPPPAGAWPSRFAQALAETLAGARPPAQLVPWTTERARSHIRRLGPLLEAGQRPRVQRVITSRPSADVMEMSVVVGLGPRVRALAVRLERTPERPVTAGRAARPSRWLCTAVEAA